MCGDTIVHVVLYIETSTSTVTEGTDLPLEEKAVEARVLHLWSINCGCNALHFQLQNIINSLFFVYVCIHFLALKKVEFAFKCSTTTKQKEGHDSKMLIITSPSPLFVYMHIYIYKNVILFEKEIHTKGKWNGGNLCIALCFRLEDLLGPAAFYTSL